MILLVWWVIKFMVADANWFPAHDETRFERNPQHFTTKAADPHSAKDWKSIDCLKKPCLASYPRLPFVLVLVQHHNRDGLTATILPAKDVLN